MGQKQSDKFRDYFSNILTTKILKDPTLLSHQYIPDRLIARDAEIARVLDLFGSMVKFSSSSNNAIIIGTSGCGKTVVVRFALKLVDDILRNQQGGLRILPIYIPCRHMQTQQQILYQIMTVLDPETSVPKKGVQLFDYTNAIIRTMVSTRTSVILVLDEIDLMKGDHVLSVFSRPREHGLFEEQVYTGIIGITNNPQYRDSLSHAIKSTLSAEEIVFPPYNARDLTEILRDREGAFHEGVLEDTVIPMCAALSAQDHGDARNAIDLLRKAGQIAEQEGVDTVGEQHVREALKAIEADSTYELIRLLPWHSQALLYAFAVIRTVTRKQYVRISEVYSIYAELCEWSGAYEPLTMRRVRDILDEQKMLRIIDARISSLGRYGRAREITTELKIDQIVAALNPIMNPDGDLNMNELYGRVFRDKIQSIL